MAGQAQVISKETDAANIPGDRENMEGTAQKHAPL
jgi:hypothetical protein